MEKTKAVRFRFTVGRRGEKWFIISPSQPLETEEEAFFLAEKFNCTAFRLPEVRKPSYLG
ncbi:MAG: hypothetical protein ACRDF4_07130 [Rhabdochlamydiaceae bacterium]